MQAIILAAGKASRFSPFNSVPKSMIRLSGKPLLVHTIEGLKKSGVNDIVIVIGKNSVIPSIIGDGSLYATSLTFVEQEEALGMGDALLRARKHIQGPFLLLHGHHVSLSSVFPLLDEKKNYEQSSWVFLIERENTWEYGVAQVSGDKLLTIVEKPKKGEEPSKLCLLGMYYLQPSFLEVLQGVRREHYQFENALSLFARQSEVRVVLLTEDVPTLKYPWDLLRMNQYLLKRLKTDISKNSEVAKSASISGNVFIGEGTKIMDGAKIKGPCFIGKNVLIGDNAVLRGGVDVDDESIIGANSEVKNSIIMKGAHIHSGFIGDSVVGENSRVGADFVTANRRLDRGRIAVMVGDENKDSGQTSLGAFIGPGAQIGIKSSTMPGVVIGTSAVVGPSTVVMRNVSSHTRYYTKFQEVIEGKES